MKRSGAAALLAAALGAVLPASAVPQAAHAQDRPPAMPLRDVDVTYRAGQGDRVVEQRSRFRAADQRLRLDTPTPGLYAIVDLRARTMAVVSVADRAVMDLPAPAAATPGGVATAAHFVRRGADEVAGLACTEWETTDTAGQPTLACYTPDGVMLRARRGPQVLVAATRVAYGGLDAAAFAVPPGYAHASRPGPR